METVHPTLASLPRPSVLDTEPVSGPPLPELCPGIKGSLQPQASQAFQWR